MSEYTLSIAKLIEAIKNNAVDELRDEMGRAGKIMVLVYRWPRTRLRVKSSSKRLLDIKDEVFNRLEYSLLKATIEASKNGRLPTFKDIADIASDYKATAKFVVALAELGYILFPDPVKASRLVEASNALTESKYQRRISKVLDLPIVLNIEALEKSAEQIACILVDNKLSCNHSSSHEERAREKIIVKLLNEYI